MLLIPLPGLLLWMILKPHQLQEGTASSAAQTQRAGTYTRRNAPYLFELQLPILIVVQQIEEIHLADFYHFHGFLVVIRW